MCFSHDQAECEGTVVSWSLHATPSRHTSTQRKYGSFIWYSNDFFSFLFFYLLRGALYSNLSFQVKGNLPETCAEHLSWVFFPLHTLRLSTECTDLFSLPLTVCNSILFLPLCSCSRPCLFFLNREMMTRRTRNPSSLYENWTEPTVCSSGVMNKTNWVSVFADQKLRRGIEEMLNIVLIPSQWKEVLSKHQLFRSCGWWFVDEKKNSVTHTSTQTRNVTSSETTPTTLMYPSVSDSSGNPSPYPGIN